MDLWCYERVIEWRGQNPKQYTEQEPELTLAQTLLRDDLANDKCVWTGSFMSDLSLFIEQKHSLISVFCAHPLHPFTKLQRLGVFIAILGVSSAFCSLAYALPLAFALPVGLAGLVFTTTVSYYLTKLAHCSRTQTLGFVQRKTEEVLSTTVLFLFVVFGVILGALVLRGTINGSALSLSGNVVTFAVNYALSLIAEILVLVALFSHVWTRQRRQCRGTLDGRLAKQGRRVHLFNVSYLEYRDCVVLQKEHWQSQEFKNRRNLLDVLKLGKLKQPVLKDAQTARKIADLQKKKGQMKGLEKWAIEAQMRLALAKTTRGYLFSDSSKRDPCSDHRSINDCVDDVNDHIELAQPIA